MPTGQVPPLPKYSITSIVEASDTSQPGQLIPSQKVSFSADNGIVGSVMVPDTQINDLGAAQTAVEAKIQALTNILNLGK